MANTKTKNIPNNNKKEDLKSKIKDIFNAEINNILNEASKDLEGEVKDLKKGKILYIFFELINLKNNFNFNLNDKTDNFINNILSILNKDLEEKEKIESRYIINLYKLYTGEKILIDEFFDNKIFNEIEILKSIEISEIKKIFLDLINNFYNEVRNNNKKNFIETSDDKDQYEVLKGFLIAGNKVNPTAINPDNISYIDHIKKNHRFIDDFIEFKNSNQNSNVDYFHYSELHHTLDIFFIPYRKTSNNDLLKTSFGDLNNEYCDFASKILTNLFFVSRYQGFCTIKKDYFISLGIIAKINHLTISQLLADKNLMEEKILDFVINFKQRITDLEIPESLISMEDIVQYILPEVKDENGNILNQENFINKIKVSLDDFKNQNNILDNTREVYEYITHIKKVAKSIGYNDEQISEMINNNFYLLNESSLRKDLVLNSYKKLYIRFFLEKKFPNYFNKNNINQNDLICYEFLLFSTIEEDYFFENLANNSKNFLKNSSLNIKYEVYNEFSNSFFSRKLLLIVIESLNCILRFFLNSQLHSEFKSIFIRRDLKNISLINKIEKNLDSLIKNDKNNKNQGNLEKIKNAIRNVITKEDFDKIKNENSLRFKKAMYLNLALICFFFLSSLIIFLNIFLLKKDVFFFISLISIIIWENILRIIPEESLSYHILLIILHFLTIALFIIGVKFIYNSIKQSIVNNLKKNNIIDKKDVVLKKEDIIENKIQLILLNTLFVILYILYIYFIIDIFVPCGQLLNEYIFFSYIFIAPLIFGCIFAIISFILNYKKVENFKNSENVAIFEENYEKYVDKASQILNKYLNQENHQDVNNKKLTNAEEDFKNSEFILIAYNVDIEKIVLENNIVIA